MNPSSARRESSGRDAPVHHPAPAPDAGEAEEILKEKGMSVLID